MHDPELCIAMRVLNIHGGAMSDVPFKMRLAGRWQMDKKEQKSERVDAINKKYATQHA